MEKPSEKVLHSIKLLKSDVRFQNLLEWLRVSLERADKNNRALSGDHLYRSQGEAATLATITGYVDGIDGFIKK